MIATNRSARDGRRLVHAIRRLAFALALAAPCLASRAKADAVSAGQRAFLRHDYVRAASLLMVEASGSPTAQTYLGYMYQYGLGVPRDYVLASSWLHQAAEQGEPTGQFLLGLLFDNGYGVPQDWVEAEVWLNLAAAHAGDGNRTTSRAFATESPRNSPSTSYLKLSAARLSGPRPRAGPRRCA